MRIGILLTKILNRLRILSHFNMRVKMQFNNWDYTIPVLGGIGFEHLYLRKDYDFSVYEFFQKEIASGIFLDVGANIGQTILKINSLQRATQIFAIEPNPSCLTYLEELKRDNHLDRVTLIPTALFDSVGIQKLYTLSTTDTSASLVNSNRPGFFNNDEFILINSIDGHELQSLLTEKVSFIKIDVEGAELNVLRSLKNVIDQHAPIIYCEVLDAHNHNVLEQDDSMKAEIFSFIKNELQYSIYRFNDHALFEIVQFPSRIFSASNLDACNYVLLKMK